MTRRKSNSISLKDNKNITKSDSYLSPSFVDHYVLPYRNLNGHCFSKENNISVLKKNIIIFGADMSSPADIEKKSKKIIILGEGTTQELDDTTLTAQSKYGNFVYITKKKICIKSAL